MTADPDALQYYVDESALGIGKTLAAARRDTIHVGHDLSWSARSGAQTPTGCPSWPRADSLSSAATSASVRGRRSSKYLKAAGLRVFRIGGKRDLSTWDWLTRLVRHWDQMEEIVRSRGPGPWFYVVNENSVVELDVL